MQQTPSASELRTDAVAGPLRELRITDGEGGGSGRAAPAAAAAAVTTSTTNTAARAHGGSQPQPEDEEEGRRVGGAAMRQEVPAAPTVTAGQDGLDSSCSSSGSGSSSGVVDDTTAAAALDVPALATAAACSAGKSPVDTVPWAQQLAVPADCGLAVTNSREFNRLQQQVVAVWDKARLLKSMLASHQSSTAGPVEALKDVVGYLEIYYQRLHDVIEKGTYGILTPAMLDQCRRVRDEVRSALDAEREGLLGP
jgi:hypothetical protein